MMKWCNKCQTFKSKTDYYKCKHTKDGLQSCCKTCDNLRNKEYSNSSRGKRIKKKTQLKYEYGISVSDYNTMFKKQNERCAICYKQRKLYVDHCHKTNVIRGLLCHKCNTAIGFLEDDPNIADAAYEYLTAAHKNEIGFMPYKKVTQLKLIV